MTALFHVSVLHFSCAFQLHGYDTVWKKFTEKAKVAIELVLNGLGDSERLHACKDALTDGRDWLRGRGTLRTSVGEEDRVACRPTVSGSDRCI